MSDKKYLNKSMVQFTEESRINSGVSPFDFEQERIDTVELYKLYKYANALSQTTRLGHFIPCDENDVPMEKPKNYEAWLRKALNTLYDADLLKYEKYQQACDRVLFDGFECKEAEFCDELMYEVFKDNLYIVYDPDQKTFEIENEEVFMNSYDDLVKYNLLLTEAGAKKFGYE